MNHSHEHPVETRARRPSLPSSAVKNSPERPAPEGVQPASIPFEEALLLFRSAHIRAGLIEPRRSQFECALVADMRAESGATRARGEPNSVSAGTQCKSIAAADRFMTWARAQDHLSVPLIRQVWKCSRATAYRRLSTALALGAGAQ